MEPAPAPRRHLEICVEDVAGALAAEAGGAERIELCSALSEGGLTPSLGLVEEVRAAVEIEIVVLARPRRADFVYSKAEFAVLERDVRRLVATGVDGVALGVLHRDCGVDRARTRALVEAAGGLRVTFHRAFDFVTDVLRALADIRACGVSRVLTSGQASAALAGAAVLARLVERAGSDLEIIAAGGVRSTNVAELVKASGVRAVHASASRLVPSALHGREGGLALSSSGGLDEGTRRITDGEEVRFLRRALDAVPPCDGRPGG